MTIAFHVATVLVSLAGTLWINVRRWRRAAEMRRLRMRMDAYMRAKWRHAQMTERR